MYCVAVTFKMTEQLEQQICIKSCIKLEHSSTETIQMMQRMQLWAPGDWQLHHDSVSTRASRLLQSFFTKHQITQPPYSPDLLPCNFWLFPKPKSPLKGKRFQTVSEAQENTKRQLMVIGRTVRSQGAYFEGD